MARAGKVAIGFLLLLLAAAVVLVIAAPLLVNVDRYRPEVVSEIEQRTGHPVRINHLAVTFNPLVSIRADGFALENPRGFPAGDFVSTKSIYAVLDYHALWRRRVAITSLVLTNPSINLVSNGHDAWNFDMPPGVRPLRTEAARSDSTYPSFSLESINQSQIRGGQLTVAALLPSGQAGPPFLIATSISLNLNHVDLNAFTSPDSGNAPPIKGSLRAASLAIGRLQGTAVKSDVSLISRRIGFENLSFKVYGGQGSGSLVIGFLRQPAAFNAVAHLSGVDMAALLQAFPGAQGKMSGHLDGNFKLQGEFIQADDPLAGKTGTGNVTVRDGNLPTLKLNRNLALLGNLADIGPASGDPSSFSLLSTDVEIGDGHVHSNHFVLNGNGVNVEMGGNLALAGAGSLDYNGTAKIRSAQNAMSSFVAGLAGATFSNGMLTFPFALTGTPEQPRFKPRNAVGGLSPLSKGAGQPALGPESPVNMIQDLQSLFKRKKPAP